MPKENYLLSRCCHVSSIVGKYVLFCAFLGPVQTRCPCPVLRHGHYFEH